MAFFSLPERFQNGSDLGMQLLQFRKMKDMNIAEASRFFGVNEVTYLRHENGQRHPRPHFIDIYTEKSNGLVTANDCHAVVASRDNFNGADSPQAPP